MASRAPATASSGAGIGQHGGTDCGEMDRLPGAVQQGLAELSSQSADLSAHAGLGTVHLCSGLGKLASSTTATKYSNGRSSIIVGSDR